MATERDRGQGRPNRDDNDLNPIPPRDPDWTREIIKEDRPLPGERITPGINPSEPWPDDSDE